jgi:opacity protein-like surface antigen
MRPSQVTARRKSPHRCAEEVCVQPKTIAVLVLIPAVAFAQAVAPVSPASSTTALANAVRARTPEEQATQSGFQLQLGLDHALGLGTFVNESLYASLAASLSVSPIYLFRLGKQRLVASASFRASYEYTLPDAETGRRTQVSDTRLGLSAPAVFRDTKYTGIAFSPGVSLALPTSLESWNAGLITSLGVSVTASRSVGPVDFRLSLSGSRGIFANPYNGVRNTSATDANGHLLVVCHNRDDTYCGFSNWNTAWGLSVGGGVQWRVTGSLLLQLGYSFSKSWRYGATSSVDDYTPKTLESNGNPAARTGLGQADRTSASLAASYQINDHYSLDLGIQTVQSPLTATGQVRFPFLSFGSWADNSSSLFFSLGAAY